MLSYTTGFTARAFRPLMLNIAQALDLKRWLYASVEDLDWLPPRESSMRRRCVPFKIKLKVRLTRL